MENILVIHNVETGEIIEKPLTAQELKQRKEMAEASQAIIDAEITRQQARKSAFAKLATLGLTEDEIAAL